MFSNVFGRGIQVVDGVERVSLVSAPVLDGGGASVLMFENTTRSTLSIILPNLAKSNGLTRWIKNVLGSDLQVVLNDGFDGPGLPVGAPLAAGDVAFYVSDGRAWYQLLKIP